MSGTAFAVHDGTRAQRALLLAGLAGGVVYLAGDFLFYAQTTSGTDFHPLAAMAQRPDALLIAGGVVAPFGSLGYLLGTLGVWLRIRAHHPRTAALFAAGWTGLFLTGIAYHAVYTTRGFAAKLTEPAVAGAMLARIGALLTTLYAIETGFAVVGTLALVVAILRGRSGVPRWLVLVTPTLWALASDATHPVPAPIGGLLAGGWINGWFTAFFAAAWLLTRRTA